MQSDGQRGLLQLIVRQLLVDRVQKILAVRVADRNVFGVRVRQQ